MRDFQKAALIAQLPTADALCLLDEYAAAIG
jgi:hypothetical protein